MRRCLAIFVVPALAAAAVCAMLALAGCGQTGPLYLPPPKPKPTQPAPVPASAPQTLPVAATTTR